MGPGQYPLQETGGAAGTPPAGSSNVTVVNPPGGTVNTIPKWTAATVLGNSAITDDGTSVVVTNRAVTATVDDANNVAVINILNLLHTTSGAAGNGIGSSMTFLAEDSAGQSENIAMLAALLTNATSGAETSRFDIYTRTGGAAPAIVASFSQALISQSAAETTTVNDAATVTTTDVQTLIHTTTGAAGVAFGVGTLYQLEDSAGNLDDAGRIAVRWLDATSTSEDSEIVFSRRLAGAALAQGMALRGGLTIGTGTQDPLVGNLSVNEFIYLGSSLTVASTIRQTAGSVFQIQNLLANAVAQIGFLVNTTAAAAIDRFYMQSATAATAGFLFGIYNAGARTYAVGWGSDVQQLFADTGAGLTGTTSNTPTGRSEFAVGTAVYQLVSNRCVAASRVTVVLETIQGATVLQGVVPAAGSFTVTISAVAAVAVIRFWWSIQNNL